MPQSVRSKPAISIQDTDTLSSLSATTTTETSIFKTPDNPVDHLSDISTLLQKTTLSGISQLFMTPKGLVPRRHVIPKQHHRRTTKSIFEDTVKKEDSQKQLQRTALRRATRQLKSPSDTVIGTPKTPQHVNTPLTNKIGDGTNLFDSPQRDMTPTPLDQSMKDHTTMIQRNRIASPLTPRQEPNLTHRNRTASLSTPRQETNVFETVQNLSKQNRQGTSFNQLPQPRRRLFFQTPLTIGDLSFLTPSPGLLGLTVPQCP
jgi:hypothetical protein